MIKIGLFIIISAFAVILACSSGSSTGPQEARLQVYLQDSPVIFDSVFVTIRQVAIRSTMQYQDSTSGWNILFDHPTAFDLIKLHNGNRELLFNRNVPIGTYEPLRIILGVSYGIRNDTVYGLNFPNEADSICYSNGYIEVAQGKTAQTLIDFDLFSSISYNTDSSRYYFDPQITFIDKDSTGDMHGKIIPAATVYLTSGGDTLTYTVTEPVTNDFGFYGLRGGIYTIYLISSDPDYSDWRVEDIVLIPGDDLYLDTIDLPPN